jgi:hypothetical protein
VLGSLELPFSHGALSGLELQKSHHRVALDALAPLSLPFAGSSLTDKTFSSITFNRYKLIREGHHKDHKASPNVQSQTRKWTPLRKRKEYLNENNFCRNGTNQVFCALQ